MKVEIQIWGQVMPSAFVFAPSENFWAVIQLCEVYNRPRPECPGRKLPLSQILTGENHQLVTATLMVAKDGKMYRLTNLRTGFYLQRFDERTEAWLIDREVTPPTVEQIEGFLFKGQTFILRRV